MSKKKNRKKELKRQQKLEVKVLSEQEATLFEIGQKAPIFYEKKVIDHFDVANTAASQLMEEHENLTDDDLMKIGEQLSKGIFPWRRDHELYQEAIITQNKNKRKKLLKQVLAENPDYFLAELHLWLADWNIYSPVYFAQAQALQERALQGWKNEEFADWYAFSARPYLTAFVYLIDFYSEAGFYYKALEIATLVDSKRPSRFPIGFVIRMLSLYNQLGQFDKLERFYQMRSRKYGPKDETVVVHLMIARLLQGRLKEAEQLFEHLIEINPDTLDFFSGDVIDQIERVYYDREYRLFSMESLASYLGPMLEFLLDAPLVLEILRNMALDRMGDEDSKLGFFEFWGLPFLKDIRLSAVQTFYREGFRSKSAIEAKTEKEILAIKGIGMKTVEQLKKNGVVFKKTK